MGKKSTKKKFKKRWWAGEAAVVRHKKGGKIYMDISDITRFIGPNKSTYM